MNNTIPQEAIDQLADCKSKDDVLSLAERYDIPLDSAALDAIDAVEGEDYIALTGCSGDSKSENKGSEKEGYQILGQNSATPKICDKCKQTLLAIGGGDISPGNFPSTNGTITPYSTNDGDSGLFLQYRCLNCNIDYELVYHIKDDTVEWVCNS